MVNSVITYYKGFHYVLYLGIIKGGNIYKKASLRMTLKKTFRKII